jgi:hypothetical protein
MLETLATTYRWIRAEGEGDMSYQLIHRGFRKARKPHKCVWCAEVINVGERYEHERSR